MLRRKLLSTHPFSFLGGAALFPVAALILFANDCGSVTTEKSLSQGVGSVKSIPSDKINAALDGKLVHMTGEATTTETLADPQFKVSAKQAIKLTRKVEMYQWVETSRSETVKNSSGKVIETYTVYSHDLKWEGRAIDSSSFHERDGYHNPPMRFETASQTAKQVTLGAFTLSPALVEKLSHLVDLPATEADLKGLPPKLHAKLDNGSFYLGDDPQSPSVGDVRVSFQVVNPEVASLVAVQKGTTFTPWVAPAGGEVLLLETGTHPAAEMFSTAQANSSILGYFLRFLGWAFMLGALRMLYKPLVNAAEVLPRLRNMLNTSVGVFSFVVASALSTFLVGLPWLFYSPLFAIMSMALAVGMLFAFDRFGRNSGQKKLANMGVRVEHVTIEGQSPDQVSLPVTDSVVKGKFSITANKVIQVNSMKAELVAEYDKGGKRHEVVLGEDIFPDPNTSRSDDMQKYPFGLQGQPVQDFFIISMMDPKTNTSTSIPTELAKVGVAPEQAKFFVRTSVALDGIALRPEAKSEIRIVS